MPGTKKKLKICKTKKYETLQKGGELENKKQAKNIIFSA